MHFARAAPLVHIEQTLASKIEIWKTNTYIAGASAIKTSTLSLRVGWIDNVAKAWALPWEKPTYDKDGCAVVVKM